MCYSFDIPTLGMKCSHTGNKMFPLGGIIRHNKEPLFQDKWRLSLNKYGGFWNIRHFLVKPNIRFMRIPLFKGVLSNWNA